MLWRRCAHLGRALLPLEDQEPWRQVRHHENLLARGVETAASERLIEVFAALSAHADAVEELDVDRIDRFGTIPQPNADLAHQLEDLVTTDHLARQLQCPGSGGSES
ncbi:hypothetical protein [Streptomyces purpurascens]|uniref:hypothetical protein n=1 Tax=Streptomyces purpurascens TaxID=1924 RepID=UPI003C2B81CB